MKNTRHILHTVPRLALTLLVPALALAGCSHKPTIVGKWQGTVTQSNGSMNSTFEFAPDGKETISSLANAGGMTMKVSGNGTYTVDGTNLTQTLTGVTVNGGNIPLPARPGKPSPFTLDGDHLTLMDPSGKQSMTLTRVKQ